LIRFLFDEFVLGGVTGAEDSKLARVKGDDAGGALDFDERWCAALPGRGEGYMPVFDEMG
jgi:hypothetical protein